MVIEENEYIQLIDDSLPYCKGCFNEKGPCGTPCQMCPKAEEWQKKWKIKGLIWEQKR